jgi:hypothetical protein
MNNIVKLLAVIALALAGSFVHAAPLTISLSPDKANPDQPTMGDQMQFHSVIANAADKSVEGLVAWISLVEIDPGNEQPVDLEDWSAQKAVTGARLEPSKTLETTWPMRLIKQGDYRVVISVTDRDQLTVYTSPTVEFHVTQKPVVESSRILPVAFGVPLFLIGLIAYRHWQTKRHTPSEQNLT